MKPVSHLFIFILILTGVATSAQTKTNMNNTPTIYNITINDINGEVIDFNNYKGKYILLVNVASKCGFTKQYKDLQKLHTTYQEQLTIIGIPCNQFGGQEPGSAKESKEFSSKNYGVVFLI